MIQDSGERTCFDTGAVRDIQQGKGRFDLMPIRVIAEVLDSNVVEDIAKFIETRDIEHLYEALIDFSMKAEYRCLQEMFLEVAIHFEEGAKKYGENNWQKGIPESSYIDSALRHYMKWGRADNDERHDRAFVWNIMCLIWTVQNNTGIEGKKINE